MKIVSYNIQDGGVGREHLVLKVIEGFNADVLILQEVTGLYLAEEISKKFNMFLYVARGNGKRSLALLSKNSLSYFNSFHPFPLRHTLLEAKLELGHQEIYFFGVHLAAYPFVLFEFWRLLEVSIILSRINTLGTKNIIMCGDFNSVAPSDNVDLGHLPKWMRIVMLLTQGGKFPKYAIRKLYKSGLLDCHRELNKDAGYTLLTLDPHIRLDYFFVSQSLHNSISKCEVITEPDNLKFASDHFPILLEVNI